MKHNVLFLYLLGVLTMLSSCGNSSRGDSSGETYSDETSSGLNDGNQECLGRFDDGDFDISGDNSDEIGIRLTGIIETCNKCMGYGMVQDGMYGQPEICKFCWVSTYMRMQQGWTGFNGCYGQVDAVFNTLPADYFDELDWNPEGEYENNGGGTSADQIESEIARHEENITQLEHQLEYIEGSINRTQIEQQIIEERYEIRRLKTMLNEM